MTMLMACEHGIAITYGCPDCLAAKEKQLAILREENERLKKERDTYSTEWDEASKGRLKLAEQVENLKSALKACLRMR